MEKIIVIKKNNKSNEKTDISFIWLLKIFFITQTYPIFLLLHFHQFQQTLSCNYNPRLKVF